MKRIKFFLTCFCLLMGVFVLTGCGGKEKTEELTNQFVSKNESFQISAPKDWKEASDEIEGAILIEDEKKQLSIIAQQILKSQLATIAETGEDFVKFYKQTTTSSFGEAVKITENPTIENATLLEAEEYSIVENGLKEKVYVVYLETEASYYVVLATGLEDAYKKKLETLKSCIASFEEKEEKIAKITAPLSDTLLWFNGTYALITTKNMGNLSLVGGYENNDTTKQMISTALQSSWDVTDKASADETLKWLLEEGHNSDLLKSYADYELDSYTREELIEVLEESQITGMDAVIILLEYDAVKKFGDKAILAWDLSRAMQLSAWYYLAGYYTYEEAMDQSLEIAQLLQKTYTSWDEMIESYMYGFQYWNEDDISDTSSDSYERKQMYEQLKTKEGSPYQLDWNITLTKEW